MTSDERVDFKELRAEMRESFSELKVLVAGLDTRIQSLERSRAASDAVASLQHKNLANQERAFQWRTGVFVAVATAISGSVLTIVNIILHFTSGR